MNGLGLYVPGCSPIHRIPAGVKLLVLVLVGVSSLFIRGPVAITVALAIALVLYLVAGLGLRLALRQVWPLKWILLFIAAFQWWARGWSSAVDVIGVIVLLVLLAALVTLTTRTTALVDTLITVCRPLRIVGVQPERIGLALALGIRAVPIVAGFSAQIRDAQRARGLTSSPRAFAAPLIVKSLRHADALGEGLAARGLD